MDDGVTTTRNSYSFCTDDSRFEGSVDVMEIQKHGRKIIGLRVRVGNRYVHLARNRTAEVIAALQKAAKEASTAYQEVLQEINHAHKPR